MLSIPGIRYTIRFLRTNKISSGFYKKRRIWKNLLSESVDYWVAALFRFERDTCEHEFPFELHRTATLRSFTPRSLSRDQIVGNEKRPTNEGETIFMAPAAGLEPAT